MLEVMYLHDVYHLIMQFVLSSALEEVFVSIITAPLELMESSPAFMLVVSLHYQLEVAPVGLLHGGEFLANVVPHCYFAVDADFFLCRVLRFSPYATQYEQVISRDRWLGQRSR